MNAIFLRQLSADANVRRIELLFKRLPTSIVATLIGVFLCCIVLFDIVGIEILKGWIAYMLSVAAMRIWIWYMFGKVDRNGEGISRWEWLFAAGAFFSGIGWGALFGPVYPPPTHPDAQVFVMMLVLVTAFTGSIFLALSNITFWAFSIPTLLPALVLGLRVQWPLTIAACCLAVLILLQRALYHAASDDLQRSADAESLLAEQQAIFESSPMGIAVIDSNCVVKCNARLGELLGRRIAELMSSSFLDHFVSAEEADRFLVDSTSAFEKERLAQGMYRLRHADGSQFWAELSGRKMARGLTHSVWMIADVTLRVANEQRSQQCN